MAQVPVTELFGGFCDNFDRVFLFLLSPRYLASRRLSFSDLRSEISMDLTQPTSESTIGVFMTNYW
jgi:hypothetical protein